MPSFHSDPRLRRLLQWGNSPLHYAANSGSPPMVAVLLNNGADPNCSSTVRTLGTRLALSATVLARASQAVTCHHPGTPSRLLIAARFFDDDDDAPRLGRVDRGAPCCCTRLRDRHQAAGAAWRKLDAPR